MGSIWSVLSEASKLLSNLQQHFKREILVFGMKDHLFSSLNLAE